MVREEHLTDDFAGLEVAVEALLRGTAELAIQRTTHLRGNAQRAATGFRDEHHLHGLRGCIFASGAHNPLAGAVRRGLLEQHLRQTDFSDFRELGAEALGQVGHRVKIGDAGLVEPFHQLPRPEGLFAHSGHERVQLGACQPE